MSGLMQLYDATFFHNFRLFSMLLLAYFRYLARISIRSIVLK